MAGPGRGRVVAFDGPGRVVILNGAPRSGKSSIAAALQSHQDACWMNLGVDVFSRFVTPPHLRPGIGLRPGGGERPDIEAVLPRLVGAFYDAVAGHSRHGFDVVVDIGQHDAYATPLGLLTVAAERLAGVPAWLVGIRCPLEVVVERRKASPADAYARPVDADGNIAEPVRRWQREVHRPGRYDLEVDTSQATPQACAETILRHLETGPAPTALPTLRAMA